MTLTTTRIIAGIIGIALLIAAVMFGPAACNRYLAEKKAGEIARGQAGATVNSMDVAQNTVAGVEGNAAATDDAVKQGQSDVRSAAEGQKGAAAVNAACRFKANRDKPECKPKGPSQ